MQRLPATIAAAGAVAVAGAVIVAVRDGIGGTVFGFAGMGAVVAVPFARVSDSLCRLPFRSTSVESNCALRSRVGESRDRFLRSPECYLARFHGGSPVAAV